MSSSQAAAGDSPSASTAPSESAVADDPEGKFVAALDAAGIVYTSRYNAIALGRATCADRADGRTDDEIARDITDYSDYTDAQAGTIIAAARSNFCA